MLSGSSDSSFVIFFFLLGLLLDEKWPCTVTVKCLNQEHATLTQQEEDGY